MRKRLLTDVLGGFSQEERGIVLAVDQLTVRMVSSLLRMSELDEANVHLVENITMKGADGDYLRRQPLPLPAVYLITPTIESVNRLLDDYRVNREKKAPQYGACHLFFTSQVSDPLLQKIKNAQVIRHVASFKEMHLEFAISESNIFTTLLSSQSLIKLFADDSSPAVASEKLQEQHRVANSLATVFVTLGEMPLIRAPSTSPHASAIASILQEKLLGIERSACGFPSRILADSDRPVLLVLDRSFDPLSPLLHEFTYQSMVNDLLQVQDDRYKYVYTGNNQEQISREVLLNENDPLWTKYRHMHIAELGEVVGVDYQKFLEEHKDSKELMNKGQDLKSKAAGLKAMPKFQEQTQRYSMHINIAEELLKKYHQCGLEPVAMIEQNMACGEEPSGKAFKLAQTELRALLAKPDLAISAEDRMRLIMIYVITQENIKNDERRYLIDEAGILPEDQVAILALFNLGVSLQQGFSLRKQRRDGKKDPKLLNGGSSGYDVSRYSPPLRRLIDEAHHGTLSPSEYPFVQQPASPQQVTLDLPEKASLNKLPTWASSGGKTPRVPSTSSLPSSASTGGSGRRLIVFIVGGATYSECREMYSASAELGREIILGSTSLLTPRRYMIELKAMKPLSAANPVRQV